MTKEKIAPRRIIRPLDREERRKHRDFIEEHVGKSGIWPLNAPGMPPPGPDFLRAALDLGDETEYVKGAKDKPMVFNPGPRLERMYRRALREPGFTLSVAVRPGFNAPVTFVPGHIWGQHGAEWQRSMVDSNYEAPPVDGPHPAPVFVLGKMPWKEETSEGRNLVGVTGEILTDLIDRLRIKHAAGWYVSNLLKFMPPDDTTVLKANWIHDCLPLLHMELRIVRPRYILCLGADASKWLLGSKFNVSYMAGRVVPYTYPVHLRHEDKPEHHTAQVMTVLHPAEVSRSPEKIRILQSNFSRFSFLLTGKNFDEAEENLDHRVCHTLEEAEEWVDEVNAEFRDRKKKDKLVGWDLEWEGQHPVNPGTYIRTIQVAWGPKKAICFTVSEAGGKCGFRDRNGKPAIKRLVKLLNTFMQDKRAVGHFLISDLEWAHSIGLTPTKWCPIPLDDIVLKNGKRRLAWERMKAGEGWIDTSAMVHAIEETAPLGLEAVAMRYSTCPRYDIPLEDWKKAYCKEKGMKSEALEGYGNCPDNVLYPYANYDADVTLRSAMELLPLLDSDYDGNCCWEPFWESMAIQKPLLRIHKNGILVDRSRVDEHTRNFMAGRSSMEETIQDWAKWKDFNVRSTQQVREFLFGERLNGKRDARGDFVRIRPPGAKSLHIEPLLDTSKPPRRWCDLKDRGIDRDATPGTNKMILGILAQENLHVAAQINWVRDYRFMDQVLKSVLRPPRTDEDDNWIENDEGFLEYDAGLAASIDVDGRVRTHLYPTAETGRMRSSRPNLQNLCFDDNTEILTQDGWILFPFLTDKQKVAQYWPQDRRIDFVTPCERQVFHYKGDMRHITTESHIDLAVTPNHRCLLRHRKSEAHFEVRADKLHGPFKHIHAGVYAGGTKTLSKFDVDWIALVICRARVLESGSFRFHMVDPMVGETLMRLAVQVGGAARRHKDGKRYTVGGKPRPGRIIRDICGDRPRLGPWILEYDRPTLDYLVERLTYWGRYTRENTLRFEDAYTAEWAQILWTLSGVRARLRAHNTTEPLDYSPLRDHDVAHLSYRLDLPSDRYDYSMTTDCENMPYKYDGSVYCVTVPSSFIVTRRNGKVSVSGNSKSRDSDYKRMLGEQNYKRKIRSILKASPGYCLIEFDYKGAELYGMALMSGSKKMRAHCEAANTYAEAGFDINGKPSPHGTKCPVDPKNGCVLCGYPHPLYYDIHSNVAKLAFQLACHPSKFGLFLLKKSHFRTLAKNVIFGIAYGRGAKAIALQAKEQGINVSPEEAQVVIDAIFRMYPELVPFFEAAKQRATNDKWLCSCYGRLRRFPTTSDYKMEGEFERQAMNFPIQSMIASAVDRGLAYLDQAIDDQGLTDDIRLLLAIHDAGLVECRYELVPYAKKLIQWAMVEKVPIYPSTLDGVPRGDGPYFLGLDFQVESHWGEPYTEAQQIELGMLVEV